MFDGSCEHGHVAFLSSHKSSEDLIGHAIYIISNAAVHHETIFLAFFFGIFRRVTSVTATRYIGLLNRYVFDKRHSQWRILSNSSLNPLSTTRASRRDLVSSPLATIGQSDPHFIRRHSVDIFFSRLKKIKCLQPSPETKCEACRTAKIACRFKDRERYFAERSRAIAGNSNTSYAGEPA